MEHSWDRQHDVRVGFLTQCNEWCTRCGVLRRTVTLANAEKPDQPPVATSVVYRSPGAPGKWGKDEPRCRGLV